MTEKSFESDEVKSVQDVLNVLSELNESAVELIMHDVFDEAWDYLLKAEYVLTVLLPIAVQKDPKAQIEDTFISTVYYNLAWVFQKVGKLDDWVKYLEKCIKELEKYWVKNGTDIINTKNGAKLEQRVTALQKRSSKYNDLLMKYRYMTKFNLQLCAVLSQLSE